MKRFLLTILMIMFSTLTVNSQELLLRGYDGIELPIGTLIQVINLQEFSTKYCDETTRVSFVATNDTYMQEMVIIPKGTRFYGMIEKMNEPIVGTNASMVIKITKMGYFLI